MPFLHLMTGDQVESTYIVVFSCVAGGILLISLLISGTLWARLSAVDDRQEALAREVLKEASPKQLEKALAVAEGADSRITTAVLELGKFKDQVHAEMQRFYAIMRRNEKTFGKENATNTASTEGESAPPDEISVDDLKPKPDKIPERETKAELRARARAAGL